jgi:hypothetical protein
MVVQVQSGSADYMITSSPSSPVAEMTLNQNAMGYYHMALLCFSYQWWRVCAPPISSHAMPMPGAWRSLGGFFSLFCVPSQATQYLQPMEWQESTAQGGTSCVLVRAPICRLLPGYRLVLPGAHCEGGFSGDQARAHERINLA